MNIPKTITDINQLIHDRVEEDQTLEYKSADALQAAKKSEISKDVSAMANSIGGLIIYGLSELQEKGKKHLPGSISPIDRKEFSLERLEQIINSNISPRIDGIHLYAINMDEGKALYVVEIPQGNTAHQNLNDHRYYKRYNRECLSLIDQDIRDLMSRGNSPKIDLEFKIILTVDKIKQKDPSDIPGFQSFIAPKYVYHDEYSAKLIVIPKNIGSVYAKYVNYSVFIPMHVLDLKANSNKIIDKRIEFYRENTIVDYKAGISRFDPILPGQTGLRKSINLRDQPHLTESEILWSAQADNARSNTGKIKLSDIKKDEEKKDSDRSKPSFYI